MLLPSKSSAASRARWKRRRWRSLRCASLARCSASRTTCCAACCRRPCSSGKLGVSLLQGFYPHAITKETVFQIKARARALPGSRLPTRQSSGPPCLASLAGVPLQTLANCELPAGRRLPGAGHNPPRTNPAASVPFAAPGSDMRSAAEHSKACTGQPPSPEVPLQPPSPVLPGAPVGPIPRL
jgi:hypothetical protein